MLANADPDRRFVEAEQTIAELQEKRARFRSRKVLNQAQLVEWLAKGLATPEELTEDEHIAIFGLSLTDCDREREAWQALRPERSGGWHPGYQGPFGGARIAGTDATEGQDIVTA